MKIAIFGGSFNPIHKGHILVANDAISLLDLDELYFVPAYKNPFKKINDYVDVNHRINMIKLAINNPKMKISDFEAKRIYDSYTIDTVRHFVNKFPNDEIYLLIGSDNLNSLHKWKDIDDIAKLVKITIFKRDNFIKHANLKKYNCLLLDNPIYEFSSTKYRNGDFSQVSEKVQEYIGENCLYFKDIAKSNLSYDRYMHLLSTADMCLQFAKKVYKQDKNMQNNAYLAGLMHDITKEWPIDKALNFLKQYGINQIDEYKIHQTTAFYYLRDVYKFKNSDVLSAINIHTSLAYEITILDKILYTADKICMGRKFAGVQKLRKLANDNFEKGFAAVVKECGIEFNLAKGITFDEEQKNIYEKWSKNI